METDEERAENRGIGKGLLAAAFLAVPLLWYFEAIPGWLAFVGMIGVIAIGTWNNS
jgi:hypothetical protein